MTEPHDDPFFEFIGAPKAPPQDAPQPGPDGRVRLAAISSRAWEHPADRAALAGLRKVPGLDLLLRKLVGLIEERSLRLMALANAVRVDERQFARVHERYLRCCEVLDVDPAHRPELFVALDPVVNAGAVGVDEPFIVLHSATLELLDDDELEVVLAHELGHVLSGHVLFKTMLRLLLDLSLSRLGIPLGDLALMGIVAALREWDRKSELSADRAALLAVQDPRRCYTVHMKLAGGGAIEQMSLEAFVEQAHAFERGGSATDGVFKLLNLLGRTHPFHVTRLVELMRWVERPDGYAPVLAGKYARREGDRGASVYDEVRQGAAEYRERYARAEDPLSRFLHDATSTVSDAASSVWSSTRNLIGRMGGTGRDEKDEGER